MPWGEGARSAHLRRASPGRVAVGCPRGGAHYGCRDARATVPASPCANSSGADSAARAAQVTGTGERVVVIGDSWSAGLGLASRCGPGPPGCRAGSTSPGSPARASAPRPHRAAGSRSPTARRARSWTGPTWSSSRVGSTTGTAPIAEIRAGFARLMRVARRRRRGVSSSSAPPAPRPGRPRCRTSTGLLARTWRRVRRRATSPRRPRPALPRRPAAPHRGRSPRVR